MAGCATTCDTTESRFSQGEASQRRGVAPPLKLQIEAAQAPANRRVDCISSTASTPTRRLTKRCAPWTIGARGKILYGGQQWAA